MAKQDKDDLLKKIRDNLSVAEAAYTNQREAAQEDMRFVAGDQWEQHQKNDRRADNRPLMVFNQLDQHVKQLVNSAKQNKPSINYSRLDTKSNDDISSVVLQSIVKDIESKSLAEFAYDKVYELMCITGEAYLKLKTEYVNEESFDQHIIITAIDDNNEVYVDPNFSSSDYTTINWAMQVVKLSKDEYKNLYPDSEICEFSDLEISQYQNDWYDNLSVKVAEYYYVDKENNEIVLLEDGTKMDKKEYDKLDKEDRLANPIINGRIVQKRTVRCVKTNGHEILEEYVFPGKYIPIIPVIARDFKLDGNRFFQGIVRQAKDAQKLYNYFRNSQAEIINSSPIPPFMGVEGQFEGHEDSWKRINTKKVPFVQYKMVQDLTGNAAPPPQRQQFDPQISTLFQAAENASNDIKAITGMYDPALGSDKREASGKAILTRQKQSELGNFGYIDNLCKSIKFMGMVLQHMIPVVYDTEREIVLKNDGKADKNMKINSMEEEKPVFVGDGIFDCQVTIGPYGENKRTQATETLLTLVGGNPEIAPLIMDVLVDNLDFEGNKIVAERLKTLLPPELRGELPEEAQAQIQQVQMQAEQQINGLTQLVANLTSELNDAKAKVANKQAELETKLQIAKIQAETQVVSTLIKEDATDTREEFKARVQQEYQESISGNYNGAQVPKAGDQVVIAGVNDPISQNSQIEVDKQAALQNELKNINSNAPKVRI